MFSRMELTTLVVLKSELPTRLPNTTPNCKLLSRVTLLTFDKELTLLVCIALISARPMILSRAKYRKSVCLRTMFLSKHFFCILL